MIVSCKSCLKRYLIDESLVGSQGRVVRCISCGYSWTQIPDDYNPKADIYEQKSLKKAPKNIRPFLITVVVLLIIGLFVGGIYTYRHSIAHHWPISQYILTRLGINTVDPLQNVNFENIVPLQINENNQSFLLLKGEIVNTSNEIRQLPPLKIILYGDCTEVGFIKKIFGRIMDKNIPGRCIVEKWRHTLTQSRLMPNERLNFETSPYIINYTPLEVAIEF